MVATGRAALTDMRRLLGLVRTPPDQTHAPPPTLATVPLLIEQARAAGMAVEFTVDGTPHPLPAAVELSAYRIVQEALTNALKHAGPHVTSYVRLGFDDDSVRLDIRDSGPPRSQPPVFGNGLRGIAERVTALGGTLDAGPAEGHGFRVAVILPNHASVA